MIFNGLKWNMEFYFTRDIYSIFNVKSIEFSVYELHFLSIIFQYIPFKF